uniref:Uncharacterized protein n=1 Tax=Panagrolaimus davidi TaxID=227884 RepID=A0A914PP43_9BILA
MQEQAEIATSIQLEASLAAMKAKNDDALMLQLEQELAAVTSQSETLSRFKGFSQEQCFSAKAESYKINGEKQKAKQLLRDIDQSVMTAYWKDVFKRTDASVKISDEHVAALYDSPWVVQRREANTEINKMTETLGKLQQQFAELENSRKYKGPRNSLDNQTVEMFRNMVRSELRLHPQRAAEPLPRTAMEFEDDNSGLSTQSQDDNHMVRSEHRLHPQRAAEPLPRTARMEFEDDNSGLNMQSQDDNQPSHGDNQPSQEDNLPSQEDNQPSQQIVQDYEAEEEPEEEQNLFNDSADALQVNITNTREEDGNDFFNLLGDNHGSNNDTPMFSFLQEHTNNSGEGGANFFFGNSPQASKNHESSHGFLF